MENIELGTYTPSTHSKSDIALSAANSASSSRAQVIEQLPSGDTEGLSQLAPVDGGFAAWAMLTASFLVGMLVWGFPNSSGVLLAAYLDDPLYSTQKNAGSTLPLIGTLCTGIMYCSGLFIYPTIHYYPKARRIFIWSGAVLCFASLLGASFTTKVPMIVGLQAVVFALGGSLAYGPVISFMSEWFVQRRGLANGIIVAGDYFGGVLFPIIMPPLIARWGIQITTRIYAFTFAIVLLPALPFLKARLPETRVHGPSPRSGARAWMKDQSFWFFIVINTLQGFAHFVPLTWLPTFAAAIGLSPQQSSLALTLANGASVFAGFFVGYLSDRLNAWFLALVSLVLTSLATFVLWGALSYSLAGILAYGLVYGTTAGCWSSMWNAFVRPVAKDDPSLATTMFSILLLTRGVGNILSTPISTALQHAKLAISHTVTNGPPKSGFAVASGQYNATIVYTGSCFAGAALIAIVGWSMDKRRTGIVG